MKTLILILVMMALNGTTLLAQNDSIPLPKEVQEKAIALAEFWTSELMAADNIDTLIAISALPFALDRKKILTKTDDLRELYQKIFEKTRELKAISYTSEIYKHIDSIEDHCIPLSVLLIAVFPITKNGKEDGVLIGVEISETLKIIGFSD